MGRFTENNTEGFTAEELNEMNAALDALAAEGYEDDEDHISDFIHNRYYFGVTAATYVAAYKQRYIKR